jgi:hypothetical protein
LRGHRYHYYVQICAGHSIGNTSLHDSLYLYWQISAADKESAFPVQAFVSEVKPSDYLSLRVILDSIPLNYVRETTT